MPRISLVVCLRKERAYLVRLLEQASDCYDDLVVVHDGPEEDSNARRRASAPPPEMAVNYENDDKAVPVPPSYRPSYSPAKPNSTAEVVSRHDGRYFEGPRCFQQEPHWPFAWSQARYDWILRLDADEFPSQQLRTWLRDFRAAGDPADVSGYTCIWPLWNGREATTANWPAGRHFLFHRKRVRFFGMVEQVPVPDSYWTPLELVLHHQPNGKSYGIRNILFRRQAYRWRSVIAQSLMSSPTQLPCWRWKAPEWPEPWQYLRRSPLRYGISTSIRYPLIQFRSMIKAGQKPSLSAALNPGLHHLMLGLRVLVEKWRASPPLRA